MSTHYEKSVNLKSSSLGTEMNFGIMLVNICHIELSLGDSRRAARALSEARGIHNLMLAILQHPRVTPALRRKALKLANRVSRADKIVSEAHGVLCPPAVESREATERFADPVLMPLGRSA